MAHVPKSTGSPPLRKGEGCARGSICKGLSMPTTHSSRDVPNEAIANVKACAARARLPCASAAGCLMRDAGRQAMRTRETLPMADGGGGRGDGPPGGRNRRASSCSGPLAGVSEGVGCTAAGDCLLTSDT